MMIRSSIFRKLGGFDEDYFLIAEETDLCYRIKKNGYKIVYLKDASVIHTRSKITNENPAQRIKWSYESKLLFYTKHYGRIRIFLLRIMNILTLSRKYFKIILKYVLNKIDRNNFYKYRDTYLELIIYYIKGKPKYNIIDQ